MHKILIILFVFASLVYSQAKINWNTKFEESNYFATDNYMETVKYFEKLANYSKYAKLVTIGKSPQGRELKCLIVSKNEIFDPNKSRRSKYPVILINNGIHSGEIEGKDACMLMLKEILVTDEKKDLINNLTLLVIPVFNVDGHERASKYGRINQNGPTEMGWRTTAQNLNLNRDFAKVDSPEMRAFLKLYKKWLPDIFVDTHTTNGADYQYTITYGVSKHQDIPPITRKFVEELLVPKIELDVTKAGFLISPYVGFVNGDYNNGIRDWVAGPRFSNGYASAQNRIGLLIETHMLKPYKDRVFSTKVMLESVLDFSSKNSIKLKNVTGKADKYVLKNYSKEKNAYPLSYKVTKDSINFEYKGYVKQLINSKIAGRKIIKYTDELNNRTIPYFNKVTVTDSVFLPKAYIIPREWGNLIPILELHDIKVEQIKKSNEIVIERIKFSNVEFANWTYEGRMIPYFKYKTYKDTINSKIGDFIVETDQRSLGMIAHLLEPKAKDSFVKWGFMNTIFERTEYFEEYSMEPIAKKMFDESEPLRNKFLNMVRSDSVFANDAWERLNYFYKESPYYDRQYNLYPILRVVPK